MGVLRAVGRFMKSVGFGIFLVIAFILYILGLVGFAIGSSAKTRAIMWFGSPAAKVRRRFEAEHMLNDPFYLDDDELSWGEAVRR